MPNNHVEALLTDRDGLWIGTVNGLCYLNYHNGNITLCKGKTPDSQRAISAIIRVGDKIFILNSIGQIYCAKSDGTMKEFRLKGISRCRGMAPLGMSQMLVSTCHGLYIIDSLNGHILNKFEAPIPSFLSKEHHIYYSRNQHIIYMGFGIGQESLALKLDRGCLVKSKVPVPSSLKAVTDWKGFTVFGTDCNGLYVSDHGKQMCYTTFNTNISSDAIHSLMVDRHNNLWIGSYRGGVDVWSPQYNYFHTYSIENKKIAYNVVTSVLAYDGKVYAGTDGGGLNIIDDRTNGLSTFTTSNSLIPGNNVISLTRDTTGIWLGIYGKGLCKFNPLTKQFKSKRLPKLVSGNLNEMWQIKADGKGYIWILGPTVARFSETDGNIKNINGVTNDRANCIQFVDGKVWVSSEKGIFVIDGNDCRIIRHFNNLSEDPNIEFFYVDSSGTLWFAPHSGGLYSYYLKDGKKKAYKKADGLTNTQVVSIEEDNLHNLWLGTENGLFRYDRLYHLFTRYGQEDNIRAVQYCYHSCAKDKQVLYFGSTEGLVSFVPDEISQVNKAYKAYFNSVTLLLNDSVLTNGELADGRIELSHDQNSIQINFSVPELVTAHKILYAYKLEGLDKDWIVDEGKRNVEYTNLQPGTYHFLIKIADEGGGWGEVSKLDIEIRQPWWNTIPARMVWTSIILITLYIFISRVSSLCITS